MTDNFAKLMADTKSLMQEAQIIPSKLNTPNSTLSYIIVKLKISKTERKVWKKTEGEKRTPYL